MSCPLPPAWPHSIKQFSFLIFAVTCSLSRWFHDECLHCYGHPEIASRSGGHSGLSKLLKFVIVWIYHIFTNLLFTTSSINIIFFNFHSNYMREVSIFPLYIQGNWVSERLWQAWCCPGGKWDLHSDLSGLFLFQNNASALVLRFK